MLLNNLKRNTMFKLYYIILNMLLQINIICKIIKYKYNTVYYSTI